MYKKNIKYEDFDGNLREEDFHFHLNKAEVIEWLTTNEGYTLDKALMNSYKKSKSKEIVEFVKDLIYRSYGEKSLDGRRFVKTEEVKRDFMETPAYSVLFMELLENAEECARFVSGIMPKDISEEFQKVIKEEGDLKKFAENITETSIPTSTNPFIPA